MIFDNSPYVDRMDAASAFCWSVDTCAWSYVGGLVEARRDPVRGDFDCAALKGHLKQAGTHGYMYENCSKY